MYTEHERLNTNGIENIPLWRYMDLWKFLQVINSSTLFFSSVSLLGDKAEGKFPEKVFKRMKDHEFKKNNHDNFSHYYREFMEDIAINSTLILSWNSAKNESFALWKMYAKDKLGIAIKTNLNRLKQSFSSCTENVYIGEVEYYDNDIPDYKIASFSTLLTKHNYYSFEKEVRCLIRLEESEKGADFKQIKVDLNELIEEVYLSPLAFESGLHEIVEFLMIKHNLNFKIKMSGINDSWL